MLAKIFGFLALVMASINIFGGFLVTQRMLAMYKKKDARRRSELTRQLDAAASTSRIRARERSMSANLAALLYLASGVLFILALRGLSSPATSRRGNYARHDRHGDRHAHDARAVARPAAAAHLVS